MPLVLVTQLKFRAFPPTQRCTYRLGGLLGVVPESGRFPEYAAPRPCPGPSAALLCQSCGSPADFLILEGEGLELFPGFPRRCSGSKENTFPPTFYVLLAGLTI